MKVHNVGNIKKGAIGEILFVIIIVAITVVAGLFFMNLFNNQKKNLKNVSKISNEGKVKIFDLDGGGKYIGYQLENTYQLKIPVIPGRVTSDTTATVLNVVSGFQAPVDLTTPTIVFVGKNENTTLADTLTEVEEVDPTNYTYTRNDLDNVVDPTFPGRLLRGLSGVTPSWGVKLDNNHQNECLLQDGNGLCYIIKTKNTYYILVNDTKANAPEEAKVIYTISSSSQ